MFIHGAQDMSELNNNDNNVFVRKLLRKTFFCYCCEDFGNVGGDESHNQICQV